MYTQNEKDPKPICGEIESEKKQVQKQMKHNVPGAVVHTIHIYSQLL